MEAISATVFCSQQTNYTRYGRYYVGAVESSDLLHPDAKQILRDNEFSVQAQDSYLLRTAVDRRG